MVKVKIYKASDSTTRNSACLPICLPFCLGKVIGNIKSTNEQSLKGNLNTNEQLLSGKCNNAQLLKGNLQSNEEKLKAKQSNE